MDRDAEMDVDGQTIYSELKINGEDAEIWYSDRRKIKLKIEKFEDEDEREKCEQVMQISRKENCIRLWLGSIGSSILVENYSCTLGELLERPNYVKVFWEKSDKQWRMKMRLQVLIKKLIVIINAMVTTRINFHFDVNSISLNTYLEPNFRKAPKKSGSSAYAWTRFRTVLDKIVLPAKIKHGSSVHVEVTEFIDMFKSCKRTNCDIMLQHPALSTEQERLNFLLRVYTMFRDKHGYKCDKVKMNDYQLWREEVKANTFAGVEKCLEKWDARPEPNSNAKRNTECHVDYIYFIRSCFEHMDHRFDGNTYCFKRMGKDFDNIHPAFVSYVFNRYVKGKNILVSEGGYKINSSPTFNQWI